MYDKPLDPLPVRVPCVLRVKFTRQLAAAFLLFAWFFAGAHLALEHGGVADGGAQHALSGDDDDHDGDAPGHDGEHHQHELTTFNTAQWMKAGEHQALVPVWVALYSVLWERIEATLREAREPRFIAAREHSPPDARASGWLLVCRSALPVRGPSLLA